MAFPKNERELGLAGYRMETERACSKCRQTIRMWRTPSGRLMPMDVPSAEGADIVTHFATCPHASEYKSKAARP
jgi:hypothetical protein